jgi:cardiolipin synthase
MENTKPIADILTSVRALVGVLILWEGICCGAAALGAASLLLLLAWATDLMDGPLARHDPRHIQTWIGEHDLEADISVALGVWLFLGLGGYISLTIAIGYLALCAALLLATRSRHMGWAVQAIPYATIILVDLSMPQFRTYGILLVAWVIGVVIVTWPRFPQKTLPEFLNGMKNLGRKD